MFGISFYHIILLFAAAFGAGAINAVAGGGTLLSFPALISIGLDPKIANATSTMALWPGLAGSLLGYRRELQAGRSFMIQLGLVSLCGGVLGTFLLIKTPSETFARLVPFLILFATLLFTLQEPVTRWLKSRSTLNDTWRIPAVMIQFLAATYGAYFGAGNGILILAALGLLGISDIHVANGLKIFLAICLNIVAIIGFIFAGLISWPPAFVMAMGAVAGGYFGASVARRLNRSLVRGLVILIGLTIGILMLFRMS
ncbi:sulfite exporter TauE/SafE family protein [bacterium]|nr:sulfite exporter TauE/SafE family protein [bacterium]